MKRKTAPKWCEDDMEEMPTMKAKMDCMDDAMGDEDMEMGHMEMKHGMPMGHMEMKHGMHMGHGMEMEPCMEPEPGMHMHPGMDMGQEMMCKEEFLLAHAYVPWQFYHQAFSPQEALMKGTLFPELWGVYPIPE